jgi:hypothetical protein
MATPPVNSNSNSNSAVQTQMTQKPILRAEGEGAYVAQVVSECVRIWRVNCLGIAREHT